ncbi:hypothetical protein GOODEAATRI_016327 [Goodea atripinnis]|uniref:Uncharacterized protein n=1 Tax=Goodea atripinnis TaxID=208336 RepID=A0ABV0NVE4_9TELE
MEDDLLVRPKLNTTHQPEHPVPMVEHGDDAIMLWGLCWRLQQTQGGDPPSSRTTSLNLQLELQMLLIKACSCVKMAQSKSRPKSCRESVAKRLMFTDALHSILNHFANDNEQKFKRWYMHTPKRIKMAGFKCMPHFSDFWL